MLVYLLLPPLILLPGLAVYLFPKELKKPYLWAMFILLALLMGLRDVTVGTDHQLYSDLFMEYSRLRFANLTIDAKAPVYDILCRLISAIFPYAGLMTFILAVVICSSAMIYFCRFSDDVVMSVYCYVTFYFYCTSFNITRQYLATALILLAICAIDSGRSYAAVLLCLLAAGIHITSVIVWPFLLLCGLEITRKRLNIILCGSIFSIFGARFLFPLLIKLFGLFFPVYYNAYMTASSRHNALEESGRGSNVYLTIFYLAFVLYATIILSRQLQRKQVVRNRITELFPFCCVAIIIGLGFAENLALGRAAIYFRLAMCCMIPNILGYIGNGRLAAKAAVYVITLLPYYICLSRNLSDVVPYRFFW